MPLPPFPRRSYAGPGALLSDLLWVLRRSGLALSVSFGKALPGDFRERLMLAVTQVNACRYCSWIHSRAALLEGVPREEVQQLLAGSLPKAPEREQAALLYAQQWAEANARHDPESWEALRQAYGQQESTAIEMSLRLIRIGNLFGNSVDRGLYHLSRGKLAA